MTSHRQEHHAHRATSTGRTLLLALLITAGYSVVEALHGLIEGVPFSVSLPQIGQAMAATKAVVSIRDLHFWSLSSDRIAPSSHVVITDMAGRESILARLRHLLYERCGIDHLTLQPEPEAVAVRWLAGRTETNP